MQHIQSAVSTQPDSGSQQLDVLVRVAAGGLDDADHALRAPGSGNPTAVAAVARQA